MARRELDRPRVGLEGLHEDAARSVASAAAGELRQELEGALLGAEVREPEPRVGVDDRRQVDAGEMVALGDHLGPEQDGAPRGGEAPERLGQRPGAGDRVGVEPNSLQLRKLRLQLALEPLRPCAQPREFRRPARGTRPRRGLRPSAVVATQPPVGVEHQ